MIICVLFMSKIFFSLEIIYQELNKKNVIACNDMDYYSSNYFLTNSVKLSIIS